MKVKSESEVAPLCLTLSNPMDCGLPGSSTHGIFQAGVLEWVVIAFSASIVRREYLDGAIGMHREGDGTPLQYSCLENPMDGGAW